MGSVETFAVIKAGVVVNLIRCLAADSGIFVSAAGADSAVPTNGAQIDLGYTYDGNTFSEGTPPTQVPSARSYTAQTPEHWGSNPPPTVREALDTLAARINALEGGS